MNRPCRVGRRTGGQDLNFFGSFRRDPPGHKVLRFAVFAVLGAACFYPSSVNAQAATPAGSGPAVKSLEGFTPGWSLGARFEGSSSADGSVFDLATGVGYNFTRHFAVDAGIPYYFVAPRPQSKSQTRMPSPAP